MQSSRRLEELQPYDQSKMFVNALGPFTKMCDLNADPFKKINNKNSKLIPVSPRGGIRLPRIESKTKVKSKTTASTPKLLKIGKNFVLSPKSKKLQGACEINQKLKFSLVPVTPKSNLLKFSRSKSSKVINDTIKSTDTNLCELSFGEKSELKSSFMSHK